MRTVIPIADGRISPVFDVARRLLLVDSENEREVRRTEEVLEEPELAARARRVAELGADVLICGAISRPLEAMLLSAGVEVIPQTCGPVEDVIRAFVSGQLTEQAFVIPGCCGHRRRFRDGCYHGPPRVEMEGDVP
ncbi:MAG: NifB/NifX family molybdenum-iron cluster-binding protein [Candidatus Nealsonbacteria bacterium]|nr:NifB/NifX family molybdenum-iron cluster-binding protein [Candidatus Nealsonbacteria bacterium]